MSKKRKIAKQIQPPSAVFLQKYNNVSKNDASFSDSWLFTLKMVDLQNNNKTSGM